MNKKKLIDVIIEATPPSYVYRYYGNNVESLATELQRRVNDFHEFIRDHRSQDLVELQIKKIYQVTCEFCGYEWDIDAEGCPCCCEKAINEWEANKERVKS